MQTVMFEQIQISLVALINKKFPGIFAEIGFIIVKSMSSFVN